MYASPENDIDPNYYVNATHHLNENGIPKGLSLIHGDFIEFVIRNHPEINLDTRIIDAGASMGHFLNEFKQRGFTDLTGIEASLHSATLARKHYGLTIHNKLLNQYIPDRKFDLVTLSGVLEHLTNLDLQISLLSKLLEANGYLFIAVPDAASFYKNKQPEPFLEFAFEHINFFTNSSLNFLLQSHGFSLIKSDSIYNDFYGNNQLIALYKKNHNLPPLPTKDQKGIFSLTRYISASNNSLEKLNAHFQPLAISQEPLSIWGTGQLTARLLANSLLKKTNIQCFIDSNASMQGRFYFGRKILHPSALKNGKQNVLVASYVHRDSIISDLRSIEGFSGRIIPLPH